MAKSPQEGVFESLLRMPRFAPAFFSAFLAGILLLFLDEIPWKIKAFMIPSLVMYSIGAALFGFFHRHLALNYAGGGKNNEQTIPIRWKFRIYLAHFIWLVLLIAYNIWRRVL